jgi:hypothetical protein
MPTALQKGYRKIQKVMVIQYYLSLSLWKLIEVLKNVHQNAITQPVWGHRAYMSKCTETWC